MAKTHAKARGLREARGLKGTRGVRGLTGKIGKTGARGPAGPAGPKIRRADVLKIVNAQFMDMRRQIETQYGRMFQMQHRLDLLHALVKRLILKG